MINIYLNNKSILQDLNYTFDINTSIFVYLKLDHDIIQGIQHLIDKIPLHVLPKWVKGHKDDHKEWNELSPAAKANCYTDQVCALTHHTALHLTARRIP